MINKFDIFKENFKEGWYFIKHNVEYNTGEIDAECSINYYTGSSLWNDDFIIELEDVIEYEYINDKPDWWFER